MLSSVYCTRCRSAINWLAFDMIVRVTRPKKSTLSRPNSSIIDISYCATVLIGRFSLWLVGLCRGIYSVIGLSLMITPAACVPTFRMLPSIRLAVSIRRFRYAAESYSSRNSGDSSKTLWMVTGLPGIAGINFATLSTSGSGISITRPTSRKAPRAAMVPKVMI